MQLRRFEPFDDLKREIKDRRVLRHVVGRIKNPGNEDGMGRGYERVADGTFFLVGVDPPISVALVNDLLIHLDFC